MSSSGCDARGGSKRTFNYDEGELPTIGLPNSAKHLPQFLSGFLGMGNFRANEAMKLYSGGVLDLVIQSLKIHIY